jgi:hypothetical protein
MLGSVILGIGRPNNGWELDEVHDANRELFQQTDRGCAIIGGTVVEEQLRRLLIRNLTHSTKETRHLFNYKGAIGSFGHQITLAYGLGLISEDIYCDLGRIRDIRNKLAHNIHLAVHKKGPEESVDFKHALVKQWALALRCPLALILTNEPDPRDRFVSTCICLRGTLDRKHLKFPIQYDVVADKDTYYDFPF